MDSKDILEKKQEENLDLTKERDRLNNDIENSLENNLSEEKNIVFENSKLEKEENNSNSAITEENTEIVIEKENSLADSLVSQEVLNPVLTIEQKNDLFYKSKPLHPLLSSFFLFFFLLLILFPMLTAQRALLPIEAEFNSVLAYMQENSEFLVPAISEGIFAKIYVLPMLLLIALDNVLPEVFMLSTQLQATLNIYFISLALSFILFVSSTLFLASSFKTSKEEIINALCINYSTLLVLAFAQLVQFDFLFAALINFSLAFFFIAWTKKSAFFSMCLAFFFMTLAVFTNGALALMLPLVTGFVFLLLKLDIKRFFRNDALLPFTLFLLVLGNYYMYLYYQGKGEYAMHIYTMSFLNYSLLEWFPLKKENLLLLLFLFPFLYLLFFANFKKSIQNGLIGSRQRFSKILNKSKKQKEDTVLFGKNTENQKNITNEQEENKEAVEASSSSEILLTNPEKDEHLLKIRSQAMLFTLVFFFVFTFFFFALPNTTISTALAIIPLFSLFMAKIFTHTSRHLQRYFFIFIAISFLLLAFLFLTVFLLPQIESIYPQISSIIPISLIELLTQVPYLPYLAFFFILLALFFFIYSRMHAQKLLFLLTFSFILLMVFSQYFILPHMALYIYAM